MLLTITRQHKLECISNHVAFISSGIASSVCTYTIRCVYCWFADSVPFDKNKMNLWGKTSKMANVNNLFWTRHWDLTEYEYNLAGLLNTSCSQWTCEKQLYPLSTLNSRLSDLQSYLKELQVWNVLITQHPLLEGQWTAIKSIPIDTLLVLCWNFGSVKDNSICTTSYYVAFMVRFTFPELRKCEKLLANGRQFISKL